MQVCKVRLSDIVDGLSRKDFEDIFHEYSKKMADYKKLQKKFKLIILTDMSSEDLF